MRRGSGDIESVVCGNCRDFDFRLELNQGLTVLESESIPDEETPDEVNPPEYLSSEVYTRVEYQTCPNCKALTLIAIGADRGQEYM